MVHGHVQAASGACQCLLLAALSGCNAEKSADLALRTMDPQGHCALSIVKEFDALSAYYNETARDPFERARITYARTSEIPVENCAKDVQIAWAEVLSGLERQARIQPGQVIDPGMLNEEREHKQRVDEFAALLAKRHPDLISAPVADRPQDPDADKYLAQARATPQPVVARKAMPNPVAPLAQPFLRRDGMYVPAGDAEVMTFTVNLPTNLKLLVEIEGDVPLDVLFLPGQVSKAQWLFDAAATDVMAPFDLLAGGSPDARFQGALSKRGAFRQFESQWGTAEPGDYTIILDNTAAFTPERGDAVVRVDVFASQ